VRLILPPRGFFSSVDQAIAVKLSGDFFSPSRRPARLRLSMTGAEVDLVDDRIANWRS